MIRILIIDDNSSDAELARMALMDIKQIECTIVKTFSELKLKMKDLTFSAVLSDYNLSGILGTDILAYVKQEYPDVPFIMVSGALGEQMAVDILKQGATDYVLKDNLAKLPLALSRALAEASNKKAEQEANKKLKESEEKHKSVVQDQTEYIVRWKPDGEILFANKSYLDFLRMSESELLKMNYLKLIPKKEKTRFLNKINSLTISSPVSIDTHQSSWANNQLYWHEWIDRAFFDTDGNVFEYQSVGRDITIQKESEMKIRRSEEFKESILSALSSSIAVIDKSGIIIATNKKWNQFSIENNGHIDKTGIGSNYIYACNNSIKDGDNSAYQAVAGIRSILSSEKDLFELEYRCDSPEKKRWFRMKVTPLIGESRGAVIAHYDISNQKMQQQKIEDSEKKYRSLFEKMHEGLFVSTADGIIKMINPQFAGMLEYDDEELIGKNGYQLLLGENERAKIISKVQKRKAGISENYETKLLKKGGESIFVSFSSSPVYGSDGEFEGVMSIVSDITARKSAETKLKRSYNEIKTFEKISNAVIQGKAIPEISEITLQGLANYSEIMASKLFMYTVENEPLQLITEKVDENFNIEIKKFDGLKLVGINEELSEESALMEILNKKLPLITSDQEKIRDLMISYSTMINFPNIRSIIEDDLNIRTLGILPIISNDMILGLIVYISAEVLDELENKSIFRFLQHAGEALAKRKTEEELSKYKVNLENLVAVRTNKLNELNNELEAFNYSVSHDLRTPIRAIDIYRGLLSQELTDPKHVKYVNQIEKCTQEMNELIKSLLEFSKMTNVPITIEAVDLNQLVISSFEKQKSHENVPHAILKIDKLPVILADNKLLSIVINNLISNAIKYSSHRQQPVIEVGSSDSEKNYIIYIKDNGIGFNSKLSSKLFKPFSRLHHGDQFKGTGAGLAIVDRILRRHNGKIYAESEVDKGAIFYFTLPKQFDHVLK